MISVDSWLSLSVPFVLKTIVKGADTATWNCLYHTAGQDRISNLF